MVIEVLEEEIQLFSTDNVITYTSRYSMAAVKSA